MISFSQINWGQGLLKSLTETWHSCFTKVETVSGGKKARNRQAVWNKKLVGGIEQNVMGRKTKRAQPLIHLLDSVPRKQMIHRSRQNGRNNYLAMSIDGEVPEIHKDRKKWIISLHFGCGFTQNRKTTLRCRQNGKGIRGAGAIKNFY